MVGETVVLRAVIEGMVRAMLVQTYDLVVVILVIHFGKNWYKLKTARRFVAKKMKMMRPQRVEWEDCGQS